MGTGWGPDKGAGVARAPCGLHSFPESGCYPPSPGRRGELEMGERRLQRPEFEDLSFPWDSGRFRGPSVWGPTESGGPVFVRAPGIAGPTRSRGGFFRPLWSFARLSNLHFSLLSTQPSPRIPAPVLSGFPPPGLAPGGGFLVSTVEQILLTWPRSAAAPTAGSPHPLPSRPPRTSGVFPVVCVSCPPAQ